MSKRVCPTPGCPNLTAGGKCTGCRAKADQARGSSTARGYGAAHQRERKAWEPKVKTGRVKCRRCPRLIRAGDPWDLGHPDAECPLPTAPEHEACNRSAPRRIGQTVRAK